MYNHKVSIIGALLFMTAWFAAPIYAQDSFNIRPMQERAAFIDDVFNQRVQQLLPKLMKQHNIDFWLLISREYNEDPVLKTMLPATWLSARRTTMFVFALNDYQQVDAYAIAPYAVGSVFKQGWDKANQPDQFQALNDIILQYQPTNIALNTSQDWAHADGLTVTDRYNLVNNLPKHYQQKIISAEPLAISWLEQRIDAEIAVYKEAVAIAHKIIAEGFSNSVIEVGKTTTEDLQWWFRERVRELKLQVWFHPSVSIQRQSDSNSPVIQGGDLLHVDFGITYLRLNTDTQQHAYVLKENEKQAPDYLSAAFTKANQLQDIFTGEFAIGKTGNQVLKQARKKALEQGLNPTIYSHPIGYHGHGAGTTLGMWDAQQGVAGDGDYPLHFNTAYAIELNNAVFIKEWNKEIRIMLEEDALFDKTGVWYLDGRQTSLTLIK